MRKPLQIYKGCVIENMPGDDEPWKVYDAKTILHSPAGDWFACKTEAEAKALATAYRDANG